MPAVRIQFVFLQQTAAGASEDRRGRTGTADWITSYHNLLPLLLLLFQLTSIVYSMQVQDIGSSNSSTKISLYIKRGKVSVRTYDHNSGRGQLSSE